MYLPQGCLDAGGALAKNTRRVALVWAEKRTPSRPRVQVFDTPPGPHVRTNHLGEALPANMTMGRHAHPVVKVALDDVDTAPKGWLRCLAPS